MKKITNIKKPITIFTSLFFLFGAFFVGPVEAEQKIEDDRYIVHYSAVNTTLLTPEVAKATGITRSRRRGMINIAVQKKQPGGKIEGVIAQLNGAVSNMIGQQQKLVFNLITEGAAVYYLAEFFIDNGERLSFTINVQPLPNYQNLKVSFDQTFYVDKS